MTRLTSITSRCIPSVLWLCLLILPVTGSAEIYKWVDANGKVHFSDKKHAHEQAKRLDSEAEIDVAEQKNRLILYPEADALLSQNSTSPQGNSRALSAGSWHVGGTTMQTTSLLRFDLSELLSLVNGKPGKRIASAQLILRANTDDKLYGQGVNNQEAPGHSAAKGDNAFYLMPTHNSWQENAVTWSDFYSSSHYTPTAIRNLPSIAVPGTTNPAQDFDIDVKDLLQALFKANIRELTLEMKLQRLPSMAQVTFHSREADSESRPHLVITLIDGGGN